MRLVKIQLRFQDLALFFVLIDFIDTAHPVRSLYIYIYNRLTIFMVSFELGLNYLK